MKSGARRGRNDAVFAGNLILEAGLILRGAILQRILPRGRIAKELVYASYKVRRGFVAKSVSDQCCGKRALLATVSAAALLTAMSLALPSAAIAASCSTSGT